MIAQNQLRFKLYLTSEEITAHSGIVFYSEFLRRIGLEDLIRTYMPLPGSNRGYSAWQYIYALPKPLNLLLLHATSVEKFKDYLLIKERLENLYFGKAVYNTF